MLNSVAEALTVLGALVLVAALVPAGEMLTQFPDGAFRHRWRLVQAALLFFVVGYSIYSVAFWERHQRWEDLILPLVLLLAAIFVAATVRLSWQTTAEIRRVANIEGETITDTLVGVYNRRYLEHRLTEEIARARRHSLTLSILLFDIDHFRRLNATWGRDVGDQVLGYIGRLLVSAVRESDVVARYGGEELMVIAPSTTSEQAVLLADRVRTQIANENLAFAGAAGGRPGLRVAVSVGVVESRPDEAGWSSLVGRAEEALSRAKTAGRNRVALWQP
jgi:diguanylate cyclase (GGDEF)-like protein